MKLKKVPQSGFKLKSIQRGYSGREIKRYDFIYSIFAAITLVATMMVAATVFALGSPEGAGVVLAVGFCTCGGGGYGNLRTPTCYDVFKYGVKLILVPKYKTDGTLFALLSTDAINTQAFWDTLVNDPDPNNRIYPAPKHVNVGGERPQPEYKTNEDGSKIKIRDGVRTYQVEYQGFGPEFEAKLESWKCSDFGLYSVDKNRNIIGIGQDATNTTPAKLFPIYVDKNTWSPLLVLPKGNEVISVNLVFDFDSTVNDSELSFALGSDLAPVNLLNLDGLLDVNGEFSAITTTSVTAKLHIDYGGVFKRQPQIGLLIADLVLTNLTTGLPVTILTLAESPDGTYALTFAAQSTGDVMELSGSKTGLDFAELKHNTWTI